MSPFMLKYDKMQVEDDPIDDKKIGNDSDKGR